MRNVRDIEDQSHMANDLINRSYRKTIELIGRVKYQNDVLGFRSLLLVLSTQCFLLV